eukprot:749217-Hanusia_phi.AAC.5
MREGREGEKRRRNSRCELMVQVGTVKEETDTICRVELDATHKKVRMEEKGSPEVAVKKADVVDLVGEAGRKRGWRVESREESQEVTARKSWRETDVWLDEKRSIPSHMAIPQTPSSDHFQVGSCSFSRLLFSEARATGWQSDSGMDSLHTCSRRQPDAESLCRAGVRRGEEGERKAWGVVRGR